MRSMHALLSLGFGGSHPTRGLVVLVCTLLVLLVMCHLAICRAPLESVQILCPLFLFETRFLYIALAVVELVDQISFELKSTCLCLPIAGIKGICHHCLSLCPFFNQVF